MNTLEWVFTACAVLGGALFLVRLILQFVAGGGDFDDAIGGHHDVSHSDASFKVLSFQGITAFLMMFGLAGRALMTDSHQGALIALAGATVAGGIAVWIIGKLFAGAKRLQSSGNVDLKEAIGAQGTVYLNIPAGGSGQVQVSFHNQQVVRDAVLADPAGEVKTGAVIKVVDVRGRLLVVQPA